MGFGIFTGIAASLKTYYIKEFTKSVDYFYQLSNLSIWVYVLIPTGSERFANPSQHAGALHRRHRHVRALSQGTSRSSLVEDGLPALVKNQHEQVLRILRVREKQEHGRFAGAALADRGSGRPGLGRREGRARHKGNRWRASRTE